MAASSAASSPATSPPCPTPPWSDLLPELLGRVIAHLPFPGHRARFRAVCRAWRSAARHHVCQLPWLVLADGSFCTTTPDDGGVFFDRLPGLPAADGGGAATCVGSSDDWLALDCGTHDEDHHSYLLGKLCSCCCFKDKDDAKHKPRYLLHNVFSGATVALPELDAVIRGASRNFRICKVLMRSLTPDDDVVAVVTNNWNYNIIICRPGKGTCVLPYYDVFDGLAPNEHLFGFRLDEDDDGKPVVVRKRRFIVSPLPEGKQDYWSWIDEENSDEDDDDDESHGGTDDDENNNGEDGHSSIGDDNEEDVSSSGSKDENEAEEEAQNKEEGHGSGHEEEDNEREDEGELDDETQSSEDEDETSGDGMVSDIVVIVPDEESLNEPKDEIAIIWKLVKSRAGELLMVRRQVKEGNQSRLPYTRKVEIFKADINGGKWLLVDGSSCLAEDEALFLSRPSSRSVPAHGDIRARFIYFDDLLEAFDTTSSTCIRPSSLGGQVIRLMRSRWLTWIFPRELVV